MRWIILLLVLGVFLFGCSAQEPAVVEEVVSEPEPAEEVLEETTREGVAPTPVPEPEDPIVPEEEPVEPEPQPELTDELRELADDNFLESSRVQVFPSFKRLADGESGMYAIALSNQEVFDDLFSVDVTYKKAKDQYQSSISEEEDFASAWVAENVYEDQTIVRGENVYLPVVATVGETSDGKAPAPGVYTFEVEILQAQGDGETPTKVYARAEFTVQVQ